MKNTNIIIRCTENYKKQLIQLACDSNMTLSAYITQMCYKPLQTQKKEYMTMYMLMRIYNGSISVFVYDFEDNMMQLLYTGFACNIPYYLRKYKIKSIKSYFEDMEITVEYAQ